MTEEEINRWMAELTELNKNMDQVNCRLCNDEKDKTPVSSSANFLLNETIIALSVQDMAPPPSNDHFLYLFLGPF